MKQNFIFAVIAFVLATVLSWYKVSSLDYWLCVSTVATIIIFLFAGKKLSIQQISLFVVAFGLGTANVILHENFTHAKNAQAGEIVSFEATVLNLPETMKFGRRKFLAKSNKYGKLQVILKSSSVSPFPGEVVKLKGKIEEPKIYENFNEKLYLRSQGIHYKLTSSQLEKIQKPNSLFGKYLELTAKAQNALCTVHKIYLQNQEAALMLSMLIGRNADLAINKEIWQQGQDLGVSHIFAASALNLASIVFVLNYLFKSFKVRRKYSYWLIFTAITLYAALTGWVPSIARAWFISSAALTGKLLKRRVKLLSLLFVALLLALVVDPNSIGDLGLQFSYLSCLGIVLWNHKLIKKMNFIPASWAEPIATTIAAQALILPLQLHYFGNLPVLSVIANLVAVPLSSGILVLGLTASVFSLFGPIGWVFASGVDLLASMLLKMFTGWLNLLINLPGAHFAFSKLSFSWALWLTLVVLWFGFFKSQKIIKHFVLATGLTMLVSGSVFSAKQLQIEQISGRWFEAAFIKTASGKKVFICKQSDKQNTEDKLQKILYSKSIVKVDWWIGNCHKPKTIQAFHNLNATEKETRIPIDPETELRINSAAALLLYKNFSGLFLFQPLKGSSETFHANYFLFPQEEYKNVLWNKMPRAQFCILPKLAKDKREEATANLQKVCEETFNPKDNKNLEVSSDGKKFLRKIY